MKVATATYPIDWHDNWASYEAKITEWVAEAAREGAELLVFPEYGAMELASISSALVAGDMEASMCAVDGFSDQVDRLYARLCAKYNVHILGASGPCYEGDDRPSNRAIFCANRRFGAPRQANHDLRRARPDGCANERATDCF